MMGKKSDSYFQPWQILSTRSRLKYIRFMFTFKLRANFFERFIYEHIQISVYISIPHMKIFLRNYLFAIRFGSNDHFRSASFRLRGRKVVAATRYWLRFRYHIKACSYISSYIHMSIKQYMLCWKEGRFWILMQRNMYIFLWLTNGENSLLNHYWFITLNLNVL